MTTAEAAVLLFHAKFSMSFIEAGIAEDCELKLYRGLPSETIRRLADSVLPRGRLGRVRLVLYPPTSARALAFIAAVLRAIEVVDASRDEGAEAKGTREAGGAQTYERGQARG